MSTIKRIKLQLEKHCFSSSQIQTIGQSFINLAYSYEAEKAGAICEWAVSHLAEDGYVRKDSLKTLDKILSDESLSETDREYAEIVRKAVDNYEFGLERTPKQWFKKD